MMKSSKRILFRASWRSPGGEALILWGAKPVRLAAGGMLFCDEKWAKGFLGQDGNRLAAGRSLLQGLASTPRRRGVPFTCVKGTKTHLGLCPKTP